MTKPPVVLVVDDSDDHRFIALTELKRFKVPTLRVEEAPGGPEALAKIADLLRDGLRILVFSDYRMPQMGGIELLREVRRRWPKEPIRVVIYSSTDQGVGQESQAHGADDFMVKPMELMEFRRELRRAVDEFLSPTGAQAPKTRS